MMRIEEILHYSTYPSISFLSDISTDRVRTLQLCFLSTGLTDLGSYIPSKALVTGNTSAV